MDEVWWQSYDLDSEQITSIGSIEVEAEEKKFDGNFRLDSSGLYLPDGVKVRDIPFGFSK